MKRVVFFWVVLFGVGACYTASQNQVITSLPLVGNDDIIGNPLLGIQAEAYFSDDGTKMLVSDLKNSLGFFSYDPVHKRFLHQGQSSFWTSNLLKQIVKWLPGSSDTAVVLGQSAAGASLYVVKNNGSALIPTNIDTSDVYTNNDDILYCPVLKDAVVILQNGCLYNYPIKNGTLDQTGKTLIYGGAISTVAAQACCVAQFLCDGNYIITGNCVNDIGEFGRVRLIRYNKNNPGRLCSIVSEPIIPDTGSSLTGGAIAKNFKLSAPDSFNGKLSCPFQPYKISASPTDYYVAMKFGNTGGTGTGPNDRGDYFSIRVFKVSFSSSGDSNTANFTLVSTIKLASAYSQNDSWKPTCPLMSWSSDGNYFICSDGDAASGGSMLRFFKVDRLNNTFTEDISLKQPFQSPPKVISAGCLSHNKLHSALVVSGKGSIKNSVELLSWYQKESSFQGLGVELESLSLDSGFTENSGLTVMSWHPLKNFLVVGGRDGVWGYDYGSDSHWSKKSAVTNSFSTNAMAWHPSGKFYATCGAVRSGGQASGSPFALFSSDGVDIPCNGKNSIGSDEILSCRFTPDGNYFFLGRTSGALKTFSVYKFDASGYNSAPSSTAPSVAAPSSAANQNLTVTELVPLATRFPGYNCTDISIVNSLVAFGLTSGSTSGLIRVYSFDYAAGAATLIGSFDRPAGEAALKTCVSFHPSGTYLAATTNKTGLIQLYQFTGAKNILTPVSAVQVSHGAEVSVLTWSLDGKTLMVTGAQAQGVSSRVYDFDSMKGLLVEVMNEQLGGAVSSTQSVPAAYSASGLYALYQTDKKIHLYQKKVQSQVVAQGLPLDGSYQKILISSQNSLDGNQAKNQLICLSDGSLAIIDSAATLPSGATQAFLCKLVSGQDSQMITFFAYRQGTDPYPLCFSGPIVLKDGTTPLVFDLLQQGLMSLEEIMATSDVVSKPSGQGVPLLFSIQALPGAAFKLQSILSANLKAYLGQDGGRLKFFKKQVLRNAFGIVNGINDQPYESDDGITIQFIPV